MEKYILFVKFCCAVYKIVAHFLNQDWPKITGPLLKPQVSTTFHVIAMSAMSSMCDMVVESVTNITLFMMFIFVIKNGFGLVLEGRGHSMTVSKRHGSCNL